MNVMETTGPDSERGEEQAAAPAMETEDGAAREGVGLPQEQGNVPGGSEPSPAPDRQADPQLPPPPPLPPKLGARSSTSSGSSVSGGTVVERPQRRSSMEVSQSAPVELTHSPGKSWLRRAQSRAEELRQLFNLPPDEVFLEDFMCALRKRILLQGRMYVFSRHVCFQCILFSYHKIKVIPLEDVVDVRKKKNFGLPNSLELTLASGKREFFTSFLTRGEAYRQIMAQWRECSEYAPPPSPTPEPSPQQLQRQSEGEPAPAAAACRGPSVKQLFRSAASLLQRDPAGADGRSRLSFCSSRGATPGAGGALHSVDEDNLLDGAEGELPTSPFARAATSPGFFGGSSSAEDDERGGGGSGGGAGGGILSPDQMGRGELGGDSSFMLLPDGSSFIIPGAEDSFVAVAPAGGGAASPGSGSCSNPRKGAGNASPQQHLQAEFQQLSDIQCQRSLEAQFGHASDAPPLPPVNPAMQHVLEFELPCRPCELWGHFLANSSDFPTKFHAARGDSSIRVSKWQQHFKVGLVRDLQFVTPVKARIGPPHAMCHQTQRLQVFAGQHLVLETSQVMQDIPYADHFSVETRWDVAPHGDTGCRVTVHLSVPFSKKTLWRGFIEKGTFDNTLESMHQWREMARERLATAGTARTGTAEAEWSTLLSRGGVHHARKHSRTGSLSVTGVPVGRQLPVLARHRRSPSRLTLADGLPHSASMASLARSSAANLSRLNSCSSVTERQAHSQQQQQQQQQPLCADQQAGAATTAGQQAPGRPPQHRQQQQQQQQRRPLDRAGLAVAPRVVQVAASPFISLLTWLVGLAAALVRAVKAHSSASVVCAVGCAIIALQAALLLQQRQQLANFQAAAHAHHPSWGAAAAAVQGLGVQQQQAGWPAGALLSAGANDSSGSTVHKAAAAAASAAALGRDLAALHQAVQQLRDQSESWQAQVDSLAGAVASLAAHLQRAAAGAGGG